MAETSFLDHMREIVGDARPSIAIAGLVAIFVTLWSVLSTWPQYNRLREFKGPRLAALSKWWLIKKVGGGRAYLDFWEVTKQYGSIAKVGPNDLLTDDPELMRHILNVRTEYRRSDWYDGMRFDPGNNNILSWRDEDEHFNVAGSDTTATAIRSTMLHIITNPLVHPTLRAEISKTHFSEPIIPDAIGRDLPCLQAVIKEGLRTFPPVAGLMSKQVPAPKATPGKENSSPAVPKSDTARGEYSAVKISGVLMLESLDPRDGWRCSRNKAAVTDTMDLIDSSLDKNLVKWVKTTQATLAEAQTKKGQFVTDHPTKDAVEKLFMARVLGKAILTPGLNPAGTFVRMACGSDYSFPGSKLIEDHSAIPITTVEGPYPPCAIPEKDLKPISISQMRLETHHWGSKVLLHQLSLVDRGEAIMFIVEDQAGTAVLLKLYHQPLEKEISCNWTMLDYRVCIVKNPFFQRVHDTITPNFCQIPQSYYTLRVDHPGDIIPLRHGDGRIPEAWKVNPDRDDKTSHGYRDLGNKAFGKKDWAAAHHSYSQALDVAETSQDKQLAHLNRSLINLKLGRPAEALLDVTQAYDPEAPTEKALFRHAIALYRLNRFEDCEAMLIDLLDKFPDNKAAETTLLSVKTRLTEQRTGKYNFNKMYKTAKAAKGAPLIDCATYSKPVEIRESPGRGRGLYTTKAVKAGDLLLVEKAFEYSFIDETRLTDQCTILANFNTKRMTAGASANLWPKVVQKLYHDPEALSAFTELHHGKYKPVTATEGDGRPVVDAFLVEKILSLNSFGAPRSTRDFCGNNVWSGNPAPEVCASTRERPLFTSVGVWLLAARINHSCVGNCRRSFIGDMAIIRAARDIPVGTELTIPYRPSTDSESYQDVQKGLAKWGFICDCELCKDRLKTTEAVRVRRKELSKEFDKQVPSDQEFDLEKATKLLRVIEKTYSGKPAKQIRWCIAHLYAYVGIRLRQDEDFVRAAEMLIKGLETMGFVILATPPDDGSAQARFEVKQWGMMEHHIPWLFFQLIECYAEINPHLVPVAEHYAQIAYSIIVGEGESMWDVMPATGNKAERT
ncbi:hypothetical protein J7337_005084 [Fusarium musae]|uniref:SET domain-containing protein n=1 Tax=Fusarium musae TaxID=1042133 RepID=A0A9P8DI30_9HYPO|nr:hypothetical protein J7337_005084 [Fusarium musae]KAG9502258.1 hypothetical protein J7337_005084 [Fusarium musae]